jgi:hypothetical protein
MALCNTEGCRLLEGHSGSHSRFPSQAWSFLAQKDKNKLSKAGFATPRGGGKNAYQNHVVRSNKVIIPFEKYNSEILNLYKEGYVVRVYPEQYFAAANTPKEEFLQPNAPIQIGINAFILYRTWNSFNNFPPLADWLVRGLLLNGVPTTERGAGVIDTGHYILRLSTHGVNPQRHEGPPQGIFATEYADEETNYLSKCVLSLFIINTLNSPYTQNQASHLKEILMASGHLDYHAFESNGTMRRNHTCCPLCKKIIRYNELHDTVSFDDSDALANASDQVEGSTRSTIVNLFHLKPLIYASLIHVPSNLGWGHAICNTYLSQRACYSLNELIAMGLKVGIVYQDHVETFGWISTDQKFIRSPNGAVWIQISNDMSDEEINIVPDPEE